MHAYLSSSTDPDFVSAWQNARRLRWLLAALLVPMLASGCVRRRMTVRTEPPGAMVYVDRQPIGATPVATNFTYYGTRHFEIVKDGYRTEQFLRKFNPPWYQIPPLDFVSENLWPWKQRDERIIDVQLTPETLIPSDTLIESAEQLRLQAGQGVAVSPPPVILPPPEAGNVLPPAGGVLPAPPVVVLPPGDPSTFNPIMPQVAPPPIRPPWRPGQLLEGFFFPGGQAPTRIPEAVVTPGGSYRPDY